MKLRRGGSGQPQPQGRRTRAKSAAAEPAGFPSVWQAPPELILGNIFEHLLAMEDGERWVRAASHVCSSWRSAALEVLLADTAISKPPLEDFRAIGVKKAAKAERSTQLPQRKGGKADTVTTQAAVVLDTTASAGMEAISKRRFDAPPAAAVKPAPRRGTRAGAAQHAQSGHPHHGQRVVMVSGRRVHLQNPQLQQLQWQQQQHQQQQAAPPPAASPNQQRQAGPAEPQGSIQSGLAQGNPGGWPLPAAAAGGDESDSDGSTLAQVAAAPKRRGSKRAGSCRRGASMETTSGPQQAQQQQRQTRQQQAQRRQRQQRVPRRRQQQQQQQQQAPRQQQQQQQPAAAADGAGPSNAPHFVVGLGRRPEPDSGDEYVEALPAAKRRRLGIHVGPRLYSLPAGPLTDEVVAQLPPEERQIVALYKKQGAQVAAPSGGGAAGEAPVTFADVAPALREMMVSTYHRELVARGRELTREQARQALEEEQDAMAMGPHNGMVPFLQAALQATSERAHHAADEEEVARQAQHAGDSGASGSYCEADSGAEVQQQQAPQQQQAEGRQGPMAAVQTFVGNVMRYLGLAESR